MKPSHPGPIINSKDDFLALIRKLTSGRASKSENTDIVSYLEALEAWLNDSDGFYANVGMEMDTSKASWQLFGDALQAAKVYS
jgi:hypothetical protein